MIEADSACAVWVPDPRSAQLIASATTLLNASKVSPFIRGLGVRHLAIYVDPHGQVAYADPKNEKKAPFALYGMPISYLIDRAGRIAGYLPGEADWTSQGASELLDYYLRLPGRAA